MLKRSVLWTLAIFIVFSIFPAYANAHRAEVEKLAAKFDRPAVDARIDRVWKAIPGVNGLQVDVDETLKRWSAAGYKGKIPLLVKQIPPKTQLENLPPAPIYRGNPEKRQMALMVNVAWGTEYVPEILKIFSTYGIKGTFFLDGRWAKENPEVARMIVKKGQEIGSHAYNHPDMARLGRMQAAAQLAKTNKLIFDATGVMPTLFAPPGGSFNNETVAAARQLEMKTILWTLDTVDWRRPPSSVIVSRIVPKATNGALVLMHPTRPTVEALRVMIPVLQKAGYSLVTVSELVSPEITTEW